MKNKKQNSLRTEKAGRASQVLGKLLQKNILAGKWQAGEFLPSVRQLCETHDTCIDTACRALRSLEATGLIASEPRRGYRVLPRANSPQLGCPLAFLVPGTGAQDMNILEAQMAAYYQETAARQGLALLVIGVQGQTHASILSQLLGARAWGVIFNAYDPALLELLVSRGMPVVAADSISLEFMVDEVNQDGFRGAMLAGDYLGSCGHQRVAWVGRPLKNGDLQAIERYSGAVGGLARHGIALAPEFTFEIPAGKFDDTVRALRQALSAPQAQRPTAVLALWQDMQQATVLAAAECGLTLGKDVQMVGWSAEEAYEKYYVPQFKAHVPPAVTWSVASMVESAMARLEERRGNPKLLPIHFKIPTRMRFKETDSE